MAEQSKEVDPVANQAAVVEALEGSDNNADSGKDEHESTPGGEGSAALGKGKKKRSKKSKIKSVLGDQAGNQSITPADPASKISINHSLSSEVAGMHPDKATEAMKKLQVSDLLAGLVRSLLFLCTLTSD